MCPLKCIDWKCKLVYTPNPEKHEPQDSESMTLHALIKGDDSPNVMKFK